MKALALVLSSIMTFGPLAQAAEAETNKNVSIEWEKFNLEKKLHERVQTSVAGVIPANKFVVNVSVELVNTDNVKEVSKGKKRRGALFLDKLGMWTVRKKRVKSDLFSNIKEIQVSAILNKGLLEAKKEPVELAINQALAGFDKKKRKIEFSEAELASADTGLDSSIGLLIAVILLCLTYAGVGIFQARWGRAAAAADSSGGTTEREVVHDSGSDPQQLVLDGGAPMGGQAPALPMPGVDAIATTELVGFKSFKDMISKDPQVAGQMLKQWVNSSDPNAHVALSALSRTDFVNEMLPLLDHLNLEERKKWQSYGREPAAPNYVQQTNQFLSQVIFERSLVPPLIENPKVQALLAEVTPEDCVHLAEEKPDILVQLMNLMEPAQITQMMRQLPSDKAKYLAKQSMAFDVKKDLSAKTLQKELESLVKSQTIETRSPFHESLPDIISSMDHESEKVVFDLLLENKDRDYYLKIAKEHFPAEFIWSLPIMFLRSVLSQMPSKKRAELVYSQDEEMKGRILQILGEGKLKDLLEIELEDIESNARQSENLKKRSTEIYQEFVEMLRLVIRTNTEIQEQTQQILEEKMDEKLGGGAPDAPKAA